MEPVIPTNREAPGEVREWLSDHFDLVTGGIDGRLGEPSLPTIGRGTSPKPARKRFVNRASRAFGAGSTTVAQRSRRPTFYPEKRFWHTENTGNTEEKQNIKPPISVPMKSALSPSSLRALRVLRPSNRWIRVYTSACPTFFRDANTAAFSLLELLVVIAIIGVVSTLAITSISGIQRSSAMTTSASHLMDYLATGRQIAMTLNQPVRVWVCPGATNDFVLLYRTTNGTDFNIAAERELKLNERVTLKNPTWSTVLTNTAVTKGTEPNKGRVDSYSFRFMPDGSTDLAGNESPTLTLVYRTDADKTSLDNINFFTLQIDQQTGTVRTFRPQ